MDESDQMTTASEIEPSPPPPCPTCGQAMTSYGGSAGFIHCGWKLLYRGAVGSMPMDCT
jgi:hypothetical protein